MPSMSSEKMVVSTTLWALRCMSRELIGGRRFGSPQRQFTANLSAREFLPWTRPLLHRARCVRRRKNLERVELGRRLLDRNPPKRTRIVRVGQCRGMEQRRVVPDHDIADAISIAEHVFRLRCVRRELVEQRDRFVIGHAYDSVGAARYRVNGLSAGDRMRA